MILDPDPVAQVTVNTGLFGRTAGQGVRAEEAAACVWIGKGKGLGLPI